MSVCNPEVGRWVCYKMQSKEIINCNIELWNILLKKFF